MKKIRNVTIKTDSKMYKILESEISGSGKKVFLSVIKNMETDTNLLTISGSTMIKIMDETNMSNAQIRNSISELKRHFIIEPTNDLKAEYIVNPTLVFKGSETKVWGVYGRLERSKGNIEATILNEGVCLNGKTLEPIDGDDAKFGREARMMRKRNV